MSELLATSRVIAATTFRQGLRGRLRFLVLAALFSVFSLATLFRHFEHNLELELRLILESGLALSALLVLGTGLLLTLTEVGHAGDPRAMRVLFSLPIRREGVFLGQVTGVALNMALFTLGMALALNAVLLIRYGIVRASLWVHFGTLFLEGLVWIALAALLVLGRSKVVAFFGTMVLALLAHTEGVLGHLTEESSSSLLEYLHVLVMKLLPALDQLDVKAAAVRDLPVDWTRLAWASGHSLVYVAAVLALGAWLFGRSEP